MEPGSPRISLSDYDAAVFETLGLAADDPPPLSQLVPLYLELSSRHHSRPNEATGGSLQTPAPSPLESLVRLLIFARRTFFAARALQGLLPDLPVVEHGAGYAP
ncbi:MAG: hypothetical protein AAFU79_24695, partial [Myxococcota bacterium]